MLSTTNVKRAVNYEQSGGIIISSLIDYINLNLLHINLDDYADFIQQLSSMQVFNSSYEYYQIASIDYCEEIPIESIVDVLFELIPIIKIHDSLDNTLIIHYDYVSSAWKSNLLCDSTLIEYMRPYVPIDILNDNLADIKSDIRNYSNICCMKSNNLLDNEFAIL